MGRENSNRTRIIGLRLTPGEYAKIERKRKASTCRKISDYVRHNLFEKPVTSYYRNQSLDEFMAEMVLLRNELNHIGNNFNQAVKRLHTLTQITEFRNWLIALELRFTSTAATTCVGNTQNSPRLWHPSSR